VAELGVHLSSPGLAPRDRSRSPDPRHERGQREREAVREVESEKQRKRERSRAQERDKENRISNLDASVPRYGAQRGLADMGEGRRDASVGDRSQDWGWKPGSVALSPKNNLSHMSTPYGHARQQHPTVERPHMTHPLPPGTSNASLLQQQQHQSRPAVQSLAPANFPQVKTPVIASPAGWAVAGRGVSATHPANGVFDRDVFLASNYTPDRSMMGEQPRPPALKLETRETSAARQDPNFGWGINAAGMSNICLTH